MGLQLISCKPMFYMARPKRFELLTPWFVGAEKLPLIYINQNLKVFANFLKQSQKAIKKTVLIRFLLQYFYKLKII